jgi:hypothetical protein
MKGFESSAVNEMENQIDKLVDGELNDGEMRELLLALEAQPEGWRRCALAFVEAQTLRRDFAGIASAPCEEQRPSGRGVVVAQGSSRRSHLSTLGWAAIAASLLVAFTAGSSVRGLWSEAVVAHTGTPETPVAMTDNNAAPSNEPENNDADAAATSDEVAKPKATVMVSLPAADGEPEQSLEVPIVEGNADQFKTLMSQQSNVLSEAELKTLETTGHEVEQQRAFYPLKLDDGRQALVPMDIVRVRYTGGWQ